MPNPLARFFGLAPPAEKAVTTGTGGTGPGVVAYYNDVPLWSASRNPRRLMRQAQELYHAPGWVYSAEHRVSSTAAGVPWHLEDEANEEITDESAPELVAIRDLFEQPQALVPIRMKHLTRRSMWQVTLRHEGLCGTTFWYKDQRDDFGIPRSFLYINPARMWAQSDKAGNTIGWRLDSDDEGRGGIPLDLDEILQFDYDPPDSGAYGIGLVESAGMKAHLSTMADRHISGVLGSGGRLAGLVSPKDGAIISPDQWASFVKDWRNIAEDPQAAKRLQIAQAPIDYQRTAATLHELQIEAVAKMSREDVFGHWGVPLSQMGIATAAGMNSGDTKGYDEAVLWQGPVHARLTPFKETLQFGFLDQIARNGGPKVELVIDEPEFDDETPLYDRAQKAVDQPLTENERRAILHLDPLPDYGLKGEPLGTAIYRPSKLTLVAAGPGEDGVLKALPEPEPPPEPAPGLLTPSSGEVPVPGKATLHPLDGLRRSLDTRWTPAVRTSVQKALADQAKAIAARVREKGSHLKSKPGDTTVWWNAKREDDRIRRAVEPHASEIAEQVVARAKSAMRPAKADFENTVAERIRKSTGERIVGINETTRDAVAQLISQGFDDGLSPAQVADLIEGATPFNEARAEMIARTESALAYNEAAIRSYEEYGVEQVEAIDGDEDAECTERNGRIFDIAEALGITDHPNGTLDWAPVIIGKALISVVDPGPDEPPPPNLGDEAIKAVIELATRQGMEPPASDDAIAGFTAAMRTLASPPVVNYHPPDIHVDAPIVKMDLAVLRDELAGIKATIANTPTLLRKEPIRDARGKIVRLIDHMSDGTTQEWAVTYDDNGRLIDRVRV